MGWGVHSTIGLSIATSFALSTNTEHFSSSSILFLKSQTSSIRYHHKLIVDIMSKRTHIHIAILVTLPLMVHAQFGTMTQDIATMGGYSSQLPCAQSCFKMGSSCPIDVLARKLGCEANECSSRGWQAKNDCYCRPDLQKPAHDWLTSCIQSSCSVGNADLDASTAGSIYARYCVSTLADTFATVN